MRRNAGKKQRYRVTQQVAAAMAGLTRAGFIHRVETGHMPEPGADGRYDRAEVEEAIRRFVPGRPGRKSTVKARPGYAYKGGQRRTFEEKGEKEAKEGAGEQPAKSDVPDPFVGLDPDTHFRLARALQEELKFKKMRGELLDARTVELRVAAFVGLVKSTIESFAAKSAPGIAARVELIEGRVSEASMYREVQGEIRKTLAHLATLDIKNALSRDADVEEEEQEIQAFEQAAKETTPPKRKEKKKR